MARPCCSQCRGLRSQRSCYVHGVGFHLPSLYTCEVCVCCACININGGSCSSASSILMPLCSHAQQSDDLSARLATLTASLATISAEKSRMEASFQAGKKLLLVSFFLCVCVCACMRLDLISFIRIQTRYRCYKVKSVRAHPVRLQICVLRLRRAHAWYMMHGVDLCTRACRYRRMICIYLCM